MTTDCCAKALGENYPDYTHSRHNLAWLYVSQGTYARVEPLQRQALETTRKIVATALV